MKQRMIRRSIWNPHARSLAEADLHRQWMHLLFPRQGVRCVSPRDCFCRVNAVALLYLLHILADRFNHSRAIRARRVGERRLHRVSSRAHVGIVRIHSRSMNAHEHLPGRRLRGRHLFELQDFRTTELTNKNRLHGVSPMISMRELRNARAPCAEESKSDLPRRSPLLLSLAVPWSGPTRWSANCLFP